MAFKIVEMPQASAPSAASPKYKIVQMAPTVTAETPWSEVGYQALQNTPGSAYQFGADLYNAVRHPITTADTMLDAAAGGISRGIEYATGNENLFPENKATKTADAIGGFYKDRYGSWGGFKNAVATDPVGVMGDAATVLTGGEGAAIRALGPASRTAKVLGTAARVTNPLTVPEKAISATGRLLGGTYKTVTGATTGTAAETVGEAFRAGRAGGSADKSFVGNLRGKEPQDAIVSVARKGISEMEKKRGTQYDLDMRGVKSDMTPIDMAPVEGAFQDLVDSMYHNGHAGVSDETVGKLRAIGKVIDEWSSDPSLHNATGFDILKKRIDDMMPAVGTSDKTKNAVRAVTQMRNAVKQIIVDRFPQYKTAMENFENSIKTQTEIEKSLGLGKKSSKDTTLRRLQSVTRNNANTNYGARLDSVRKLEEASGKPIMPALAGQALNAKLPRGLLNPLLMGGSGALGAYLNPWFALGLPFFSPRLVGEATRGAGVLARGWDALPKPTKAQLLLAAQSGRVGLLGQ